jgi:hypothetical protein
VIADLEPFGHLSGLLFSGSGVSSAPGFGRAEEDRAARYSSTSK